MSLLVARQTGRLVSRKGSVQYMSLRLFGGLADVNELGLDRSSTDEESINVGLLSYFRRPIHNSQISSPFL